MNIEGLIADAITKAIHEEVEAEIELAKARITKAIRFSVGRIATEVLSSYSMQRIGADIVIKVTAPSL